jgi:RNA polymerase primary sigma factor
MNNHSENDRTYDNYLRSINKYRLLSREEEKELAKRIRTGDMNARDELVTANLRYVVTIANKYPTNGLSRMDLIQEGNIGAMKAAERFDEKKKFKFVTYAKPWIKQRIQRAIYNSHEVRIPTNALIVLNRAKKATSRLEIELERSPTEAEVFKKINHKIKNSYLHTHQKAMYDAGMFDINDLDISYSAAGIEKNVENDFLREDLDRAFGRISDKMKRILELRFGLDGGEPLTEAEIGTIVNLSYEGVRQNLLKAFNKLKTARYLREYL